MLPTPFDDAGRILWDDFPPLVSHQLHNGVAALSALGLGGEASRLSVEERLEVTERLMDIIPAGTPLLVGVSADDTPTACRLAAHAADAGAAAVMAAPPDIQGMEREALWNHYLAVCDAAAPLDVMVQDAPAFIGVSLGARFIAELASVRPNVRYAKSEAFPAAEHAAELCAMLGARVGVFGGGSALHYLDVLDAGAIGIIPGCEMPAEFTGIFEAYTAGRREEAEERFARLQPLLVFETQTLDIFIASSKAILKDLGVLSSDALRAPNPLGPVSRETLKRHVRRVLGPPADRPGKGR